MKTIILLPLFLIQLFATEPDSYTKEGYCIVKSQNQKIIGLTRFKTKDAFKSFCNGVMIFKYKDGDCRYFTMKNMNFDITIEDRYEKSIFRINDIKKVCGDTIVESL